MKQRYSILSILFAVFSMMYGCSGNDDGIKPEYRKLTESVYASATVVPADLYNVYPKAAGVLQELSVQEGDSVAAGQQLALITSDQPAINAANAKLRKELSEANISSSANAITRIKQEIESAREQLQLDSLNYERQQRLASQNIGSKLELDNVRLKFETSLNRLATLKSQLGETERELTNALKLSRNDLNLAISKLEDHVIRSRMNGKVYALNFEAGEMVNTQQVFASIGAADRFVIELVIDEVDIARIAIGQDVVISLDAFPNETFSASISKIYPTKDERTQTFKAEATFATRPAKLYNGLSGEANIVISEAEHVLVVPLEYLSANSMVKTKKGDEITVKTGRQNMELVEILSGLDTTMVLVKP